MRRGRGAPGKGPRGFQVETRPARGASAGAGGVPGAVAAPGGRFPGPSRASGLWGDGGDGFPAPPPRTPMAVRSGPPPPASPPR